MFMKLDVASEERLIRVCAFDRGERKAVELFVLFVVATLRLLPPTVARFAGAIGCV